MLARIRVLVVDDSALIRQMLTQALSLDPRIEVVGIARDGVEAIEKVRELQPDVVTLDVEMPQMTGLESLPFILRDSPARVLMLTALDDPETTYQALSIGAVDFIVKPKGGFASSLSDLADHLIKKIKTAYRVDPRKRREVSSAKASSAPGGGKRTLPPVEVQRLVVIAASTGGPPALETVFSDLPAERDVAYLVVQHLPDGFSASLARRLSARADFDVVEASHRTRISSCRGYLAPYGSHMRVNGKPGRLSLLTLEDGPAIHGVKPAADPLLDSVAHTFGPRAVGVVLTGMGQDGAVGLRALRDAGGATIVQDENTSVVWGMAGAAVRLGAAQTVVPLDRIASEIRHSLEDGS